MHEAFGDLFFGHASNVDGSFDVAGELRLGATHRGKCRHVQHLTVAEFDAFALVRSTKYGADHPVGRTRRICIKLLFPRPALSGD